MTTTTDEVEVKERPILFSGPMVKAILDGRKTQTRRVVTTPPWLRKMNPTGEMYPGKALGVTPCLFVNCADGSQQRLRNPYAWPDVVPIRLWVRETWADADCMYQGHTNDEPGTVAYFADKSAIQYDSKIPRQIGAIDLASWNWNVLKRRPSIFMPRWASRINLEITNVRVERLQEITAADAKAEGVEPFLNRDSTAWRAGFQIGWDSINGKRKGCAWADNPFVWIIEFRKL